MTALLTIVNAGREVASTNFWEIDHARNGLFLISANAGAFRLLLPTAREENLDEMREATGAALSRGPFAVPNGTPSLHGEGYELLFDDGSSSPFALHFGPESFPRRPARENAPRRTALIVYAIPLGADDPPREVLRLPCTYRIAAAIPDLRPWEEM